MHRDGVERLLPTMYQLAARPGSPLDAALHVMADLHEPDERLLAHIEEVFDPFRAPAPFVAWLTRWVGLEWLVADESDDIEMDAGGSTGPGDPDRAGWEFRPGLGHLRSVVGAGHALAQWRGTEVGLQVFCTAATGIRGFTIEEPADRPFHLVVVGPEEAEPHAALLRRIVDRVKPAATTAEIVFRQRPGGAEQPEPFEQPPTERMTVPVELAEMDEMDEPVETDETTEMEGTTG